VNAAARAAGRSSPIDAKVETAMPETDALLHAWVRLAATPAPTPSGAPSDDSVTPGVVGFAVTFVLAVVVVLLVIDMVRRIRRVRYRAEIAEKLDAEQAAAGQAETGQADAAPARPEGLETQNGDEQPPAPSR
jgi:hypothetical protein